MVTLRLFSFSVFLVLILSGCNNINSFTHKTRQSIDINGAKIYFEEIEKSDKPVMLLLHGGLGDIEDMNPFVPYLYDQYRIIGIDTRGHGKSTLGDRLLTYEQIASDVEAVLKQLNIDTVNIIGFSDGGIAAYRIAANGNIKVEKLIAIGSAWQNSDIIACEPIYADMNHEVIKNIFSHNYERYLKLNP